MAWVPSRFVIHGGLRRIERDFELLAVALEPVAHRVTQVLQEMPAIRDLNSVWCAIGRALSVDRAAIPADDLDARVGFQPGGERVCIPIIEHVHDTVFLEVDQDRAEGLTAFEREVVHAQNSGRVWRDDQEGSDRAQQRVGAEGGVELTEESRARLAAEGDGDARLSVAGSAGALRVGAEQVGEALGERDFRAGRVAATVASHAQSELNGALADGGVRGRSGVGAVRATAGLTAGGTDGLRAGAVGVNGQARVGLGNAFDFEGGW
jgi:hypothetical protein